MPIIALIPVARPSKPSVKLAPLDTEITIITMIGINTSTNIWTTQGLSS